MTEMDIFLKIILPILGLFIGGLGGWNIKKYTINKKIKQQQRMHANNIENSTVQQAGRDINNR